MEENEDIRRLESMAGATSVNQKERETGCAVCRKIDKQGWQPVKISSVMCSGLRTNNGAQIKSYAEERGVALMGDIPFGVSYYSADVFARPDDFVLDWCGGAPPEPYFKDDAVYPEMGTKLGHSAVSLGQDAREQLCVVARSASVLSGAFFISFALITCLDFIASMPSRGGRGRTSNFFRSIGIKCSNELAAARHVSFHVTTKPPENCEANKREGEEYLRVVLDEAGATRVIGEDLGTCS